MEDNTIYNFFRIRKHQFDEAPGDALWTRIVSGMDTPAQQPGKKFPFKNLIFLATAIVIVGISGVVLSNSDENTTGTPLQHHNEKHDAAPTTPEIRTPEATVTKPESSPIAVIEKAIAETQQDTVKKKKPYLAFRKINGKTAGISKDSIPFNVNNIETIIRTANGRVVVETKEKLDPFQFRQLIEKSLEENKLAVGTLVTVKAPGHKVFRQVVKSKENAYPVLISGSKDEIKEKQKEAINGIVHYEELIIAKDSLKPISDTLPKPAHLEFKPLGAKD